MLRFSANRISPFLRDVVITTLTSAITILSMIIVTRLLANGLGSEGFGAYSIARRAVSIIVPFSTLMMGVSLTRYISLFREGHNRFFYLWAASIIAIGISILIAIIGWGLQAPLSFMIFGREGYESICNAIFFMLIGIGIYTVVYAYYRGLGQFGRANLWQIGVMGLGPITVSCIFVSYKNVGLIVFLMGGLFMLAVIPLSYHLILSFPYLWKGDELGKRLKELFRYGWPRASGSLAWAGLLGIGPFLCAYFGSLKDAGYFVIAQSILRIVESGFTGFSLAVLPKAAQLYAQNRESFLKDRLTDLVAFLFQIGLFVFLHLFLWSDALVEIWLGKEYQEVIPIMKIVITGLIPYLSYVMFWSIIDACEVKPINAKNLILALVIITPISILLAKTGLGAKGIALGTTLGIIILGVVTLSYLWRQYGGLGQGLMLKRVILLNLLLFLPALAIHSRILKIHNVVFHITGILITEACLFLVYLLMLKIWQARWIGEIQKRIT